MRNKRKKQLQAEIGAFIKRYKRKAYAGNDPNNRSYDREIEKKIKSMSPEELDEIMRGDDEENYRLYIGTKRLYFVTFEEAKLEAEKHMSEKPELRIEILIETEGADFWAYEFANKKWVPS